MSSENDNLTPTGVGEPSNAVSPTFDENAKEPKPEQEPVQYEHDDRTMVEKESVVPALTIDDAEIKNEAHRESFNDKLSNDQEQAEQENQNIQQDFENVNEGRLNKADIEKEWSTQLGNSRERDRS